MRETRFVSNLPALSTPSRLRVLVAPLPLALGLGGFLLGLLMARSISTGIIVAAVAYLGGLGLTALLSRPIQVGVSDIDPFGVGEPWRRYVQSALSTEKRFQEALRQSSPGVVQDRLLGVQDSVRSGVQETWQAAQGAQQLSQARLKLDSWVLNTRHERLTNEGNHEAAASVAAQLASLERLDRVIADAKARMEVQVNKLALSVTTAIEMNVTSGAVEEISQVQSSLESVADELESLRRALGDTSVTGFDT